MPSILLAGEAALEAAPGVGAVQSADTHGFQKEGTSTELSLGQLRDRAAGPSKGDSEQCGKTGGADTSTDLRGKAAYGDEFGGTSPVGCDEGNAFGLQDVLVNVWGRVDDC